MHSRKSILWMFLAAALLALPSSAMAQKVEGHVGKLNGHVDAGKQLYFRYCWGCHGFRGDGNGENAPYLNILPRNFVSATFKRSEEHTSELQSRLHLVCRLLLEKKNARKLYDCADLIYH